MPYKNKILGIKYIIRDKDYPRVSGQPYGLGHQDDVEMELVKSWMKNRML